MSNWNILASFLLLSGGVILVAGVLSLFLTIPTITPAISAGLIAGGLSNIISGLCMFPENNNNSNNSNNWFSNQKSFTLVKFIK